MRRGGSVRAAILLASAFAHVAILAALATTRGVVMDARTPTPVMHVDLIPADVSPPRSVHSAKRPRASPVRPSPRPARPSTGEAAISPLILPSAPADAPSDRAGLDAGVREVLRGGALGCANPDALTLDSRARARCVERLGAGARDAPFLPAPLSREKQAAFDRTAARRAADRKYREATPPGLSTSDAPGGITGLGQTGHGAAPFP
jgi:hypothetical protein